MADTDFSIEFVQRVRAGSLDGWRVQDSAQGLYLIDSGAQQSWELLPDEPCQLGRIAARQHQPRKR
jgi:hypothetical protein